MTIMTRLNENFKQWLQARLTYLNLFGIFLRVVFLFSLSLYIARHAEEDAQAGNNCLGIAVFFFFGGLGQKMCCSNACETDYRLTITLAEFRSPWLKCCTCTRPCRFNWFWLSCCTSARPRSPYCFNRGSFLALSTKKHTIFTGNYLVKYTILSLVTNGGGSRGGATGALPPRAPNSKKGYPNGKVGKTT